MLLLQNHCFCSDYDESVLLYSLTHGFQISHIAIIRFWQRESFFLLCLLWVTRIRASRLLTLRVSVECSINFYHKYKLRLLLLLPVILLIPLTAAIIFPFFGILILSMVIICSTTIMNDSSYQCCTPIAITCYCHCYEYFGSPRCFSRLVLRFFFVFCSTCITRVTTVTVRNSNIIRG